jgi:threonine/homoserine/homoserine lactone efflux protein
MMPLKELLIFGLTAFLLAISPGPNMIYLISRSITQGRKAGLISLSGVMCGFLFHIIMVSFGLTAVFLAVPYTYTVLKLAGAVYLLYLAYQTIKPGRDNIFSLIDTPKVNSKTQLVKMGFLTNVLNPKVTVFYLSFFPQFMRAEYGPVWIQGIELGLTQLLVSCSVNLIIVLTASQMADFFSKNVIWLRAQKWLMASVLGYLAIKMALSRQK